MDSDGSKSKRSELLPHLIITATFCFLLSQTWLKWGDLIIDTWRELWLPGELLKGKILYKDIVSFYGFLPPYLIAGLCRIFGVAINTLVYTGIALTLIVSFTIYRISRFFLNQWLSTILVVNFLFVFAFGNRIEGCAIFNFILPYAFAATFFMAFTALSLYFFLKFIFSGNEKNLIIWSLFLTAAFLCRLESAIAVWPAFLLSGIILAGKGQKSERLKTILCLLTPLLLAALCYGIFFLTTHTFHDFKETFTGSIRVIASTPLGKERTGLDNVPLSLLKISCSFLLHILIFLSLAISCSFADKCSNSRNPFARILISLSATFIFFIILKQSPVYELQYPCITLILFYGIIAYSFRALRPASTNRNLGLLTLFFTSFLVIGRIFLARSPLGLDFSLMTLPLICYYIFFGDLLKTALEKRFRLSEGPLAAAIAAFFMLMVTTSWGLSVSNYRHMDNLAITSKGDIYYYGNEKTDFFWKTVDYLKINTPKNSTVLVFPEGISINFFSERATPLRHHSFLPHDIALFSEDKILSEIKAAKIDYIVTCYQDNSVFGAAIFGTNYAQRIQKWVDANYIPLKQFGTKPYYLNSVGILILKRK